MVTVKHEGKVTRSDRVRLLGYASKVIWLTGLSGSGKSTIASHLETAFHDQKQLCYVLDGDNIRQGLNGDLTFSPEHRQENIRRIAEVAKLFHDAGVHVIVSFISPYREDRAQAKQRVGDDFVEVHIACPLEECEKRDVKGLYKKARAGEIPQFTGISAPYEAPENPDVVVETHNLSVEESVQKILDTI